MLERHSALLYYILTLDQSDAGSTGIFSRWTNRNSDRKAARILSFARLRPCACLTETFLPHAEETTGGIVGGVSLVGLATE
eukprot:4812166-Pyramimonas_sp.AAC.1